MEAINYAFNRREENLFPENRCSWTEMSHIIKWLDTSWSGFWEDVYVVTSKILEAEGQFWRLVQKKHRYCFKKTMKFMHKKNSLENVLVNNDQLSGSILAFCWEYLFLAASVSYLEWLRWFRKLLSSVKKSV